DGTHRFEIGGIDALTREALEFHYQINSIDAVDIEVLIKTCLGDDFTGLDLEELDQGLTNMLEECVVFQYRGLSVHGVPPRVPARHSNWRSGDVFLRLRHRV